MLLLSELGEVEPLAMGADETERADVLAEKEAGTKAVLSPTRHEAINKAAPRAENFIVIGFLAWVQA